MSAATASTPSTAHSPAYARCHPWVSVPPRSVSSPLSHPAYPCSSQPGKLTTRTPCISATSTAQLVRLPLPSNPLPSLLSLNHNPSNKPNRRSRPRLHGNGLLRPLGPPNLARPPLLPPRLPQHLWLEISNRHLDPSHRLHDHHRPHPRLRVQRRPRPPRQEPPSCPLIPRMDALSRA